MILLLFIVVPLAAGLLSWFIGRSNSRLPVWISLSAMVIDLVLALFIWAGHYDQFGLAGQGKWLIEVNREWIPQFGITFHLAMDSLSLILVTLTAFLGITAVVSSWTEIKDRAGFFHFNLMFVLAGIIGVFLSIDLFLFYFFWELMLVPMYFLIALWGHENRIYAAVKFFLFTQFSGLLMLAAILGLYFIHGGNTGSYTFDYMQLIGTSMSPSSAKWLMLGFLTAFAVKLPVVPVHTWLPDAHTEAPTAGSVILAGLLLKTGAYGLLRFVIPLFPEAALDFAPIAMFLGVIGILYGAVMAFAQRDIKRLVAYTSVSHMGFVLLGIFALNTLALQGAVMQIVCHGISTGALFFIAGALQERVHTRDMGSMGGLWSAVPRIASIALFFALASLGLPGLGNFAAEFLILVGAYQVNIPMTVLATAGLVTATIYALWMTQTTFFGPNKKGWKLPDFTAREMVVMSLMIITLVWLGLYPQPLLNTAKEPLSDLQEIVTGKQTVIEKQTTGLPGAGSGIVQATSDREDRQ
jgi:NADH-quinone oxidoreductase subunit M